jgi:two-component system OmpR family response regulator
VCKDCYLNKGVRLMVGVASPDLNLPHVLIVDDEDAICEMLSRYLSRNGFRTSVASSGKGMMTRLEQESYDLILLESRC